MPSLLQLCWGFPGFGGLLSGDHSVYCRMTVSLSSAHGIPKATPPHKLWQPQTPVRAKYVTEQSYCAKALPFRAGLVPPAYEY